MKEYKIGSAAWKRQRETQRAQQAAEAREKTPRRTDGQKYLHPERRRKNGNG